jgi:GDP-L-fucose synthase
VDRTARVFVAGSRGLVGRAIVRRLQASGYQQLLLPPRAELDLTDQVAVHRWFVAERPTYVFLAAAKVGGILANSTLPADFIRDNLLIQSNVIDAAYRSGVQKLLFLGSSCIYPKHCPQPIREEFLLTGTLEPTNQAYAVAKIAGIEMCRAYRHQFGFSTVCLMPTNLYGPGDNFDLKTAHVLPALLRKMHEAKLAQADAVEIWGSGEPRREFLHVDDLARACQFVMEMPEAQLGSDLINVGCGEDLSIRELAEMTREAVGFTGKLVFDRSKPDGTPRKLLDVSKLAAFGWRPEIGLRQGLADVYRWYCDYNDHRNGEGLSATP